VDLVVAQWLGHRVEWYRSGVAPLFKLALCFAIVGFSFLVRSKRRACGSSAFRKRARRRFINGLPCCRARSSSLRCNCRRRTYRFGEPNFVSMSELIDAVAEAITPYLDPAGFFGHSMGALIAFELARRFRDAPLRHMVVSGRHAPQLLGRRSTAASARRSVVQARARTEVRDAARCSTTRR
jgi:pimeloyl-ACP methyl ester carboxylesterase